MSIANRNIRKRFGAFHVLDDDAVSVWPRHIHIFQNNDKLAA